MEEAGKGPESESSAKKKGRTVVITTEDMQKRRNDVKARTTLLLDLPDEHQLRFSKYETAQELWGAILKTFGGNEATKKTKKNQLKQQYGNFKAKGSVTLEKTFNRLQAIVKWLMYTIMWRNSDDLDTMSLDDVYNHLKVYEPEVQKNSESNSQNMAFISSANTSSGKGKVHTNSVPTASTQVSTASADVAATNINHDTICAYISSQSNGSQIKYKDITRIDEDDIKEIDIKWNMALLSMRADRFWKKTGKKITIQEENHALVADDEAPTKFALMAKSSSSSENKEVRDLIRTRRVLDAVLFPPPAQVYSPPKKDMSWTGLLEFADITITNYSRPLPSIESNTSDLQNGNSSVSKHEESSSSIMSKPMIKFVKATDSPTIIKTSKTETAKKPPVKYAKMYRNTSKKILKLRKTWPKNNCAHKNVTPRAVLLKTGRTPIAVNRTNMNVAQPKRTSFTKTAHSYVRRPFQGKSTVRTQFRVTRVSTVTKKFPTVDSKFSTDKSTFTADLGNK
nr:hypothetical protein [Tanacetum cinerariifolium]